MALDSIDISPSQLSACQALVYGLLQRCEGSQSESGFVVAFVSAHPGAGVSHIQWVIKEMLNENEAECAIDIDCDSLGLTDKHRQRAGNEYYLDFPDTRPGKLGQAQRAKLARYRDRVEHLNDLRDQYRYVLLDCHSLRERTDILGLAPMIDGAILVIECNRTTTAQTDELERSIERYGGTVLGSVLNKTTYPVPRWMNSLMERAGI
jgi:hypothetical protein